MRRKVGPIVINESIQSDLFYENERVKEEQKILSWKNLLSRVMKNYHLIEDTIDEKGFSRNEPGTAMKINLKNGRSLLVTQWNNLTKNNTIIVLEPDHKNKKVKKHCEIKNFSDEFKARVSIKRQGKFMVNINEPVTEFSEKFHRVWKTCPLEG